MLVAMWGRTCSNYYILAIVASFLVWIVATLAPGACKSCAKLSFPFPFLLVDSDDQQRVS